MQVILFILMLTACTEHIIALGFVTFIKLVLGTNKCVGCPEHSRAIGNWQGCEAKTFFFMKDTLLSCILASWVYFHPLL